MFFLEKSREFWEILENLDNSGKFSKISGKSRKFSEILRGIWKNLDKSPDSSAESLPESWFSFDFIDSIGTPLIFQRSALQFSGSRNFAQNGFSWPRSGINLSIKGMRKVEKRTSSRARWKDILKHLPICVIFSAFGPRSIKVEGGCSGGGWPRDSRTKNFFLGRGTLQPLETSARLSQETRTESWDAEKLRCWEAEMLSCWVLRAPGIPLKRATELSRYGKEFFWGGPYSTFIKSDFLVIFHVDRKLHFFAFLAPQAPKIRFWGWFWSNFLKENHRKIVGNVRKCGGILENSRKFLGILGNSWEFSDIPGNSQEFLLFPQSKPLENIDFHWFPIGNQRKSMISIVYLKQTFEKHRFYWFPMISIDSGDPPPHFNNFHQMDSVGPGPKPIF